VLSILLYRPGPLSGKASVISGELQAGGNSICLCLTGVLLWPPQKATLDSLRTLSWFISSRWLTPEFQHSLSAVNLGFCLGGMNSVILLLYIKTRKHEGHKMEKASHFFIVVFFGSNPPPPCQSTFLTSVKPAYARWQKRGVYKNKNKNKNIYLSSTVTW
jgi:hypothetical protein